MRYKILYLEYKYLPGGSVDVEFAVSRVVGIDALTCQKVDDVVGPVFISIRGHNL